MNQKTSDYQKQLRYQENEILEHAAEILANRYVRGDVFCNPEATKEFVRCKLGGYEQEVFALMLLDNQHRLIEFKELFRGTTSKYLKPVIPDEVSLSLGLLPDNHQGEMWNQDLTLSKERLWLNKIHVELPDISHWNEAQKQVLQAVHTVLLNNRLLTLSSQVMRREEFIVEPLGILVRTDSLLLLFRQSKDHPIQTIAIPLIDKAKVSTFSFTYPSDFNLERYTQEHRELSS